MIRGLKRKVSLVLSLALTLSIVSLKANSVKAEINTQFNNPISLGSPIQSIGITDSAYGVEDGYPVMYTTLNGSPAYFNVIRIDTNEFLRSFELKETSGSWSHVVDSKGNVYIGGNGGKLFRYSPVTKDIKDFGTAIKGETQPYGLSVDAEDNVYGGTYPNGKVFKFDVVTETIKDYGQMVTNQKYVRGLAYYDGHVYAGIGASGSIVKLNVTTGEKENFPIPVRATYYDSSKLSFVYGINVVGNYMFVHLQGTSAVGKADNWLIIYDFKNGSWLNDTYPGYKGLYVSPEYNGKSYFVANGKVMSFEHETTKVEESGISFGTFLRQSGWVDMKDNPELPGMNLVTMQFGGTITFMNLQKKITKAMPAVVEGQPIDVQSLEKGSDGKIYLSGYMGTTAVQYNTSNNTAASFNMGQVEGMGVLGSKIYMGVYPGALIYELDITKAISKDVNPKQIYDIADNQDRPFAFTSGDNKVFVGTIPEYGHLGGVLGIYDTLKGTWSINRNVVEDQSVIGLAYKDGKIYGSTSVWGGLGSVPTATEAKIFVWDIEKGEKVKEFAPSIPGVATAPKAIGGLSFGSDGLLWGAARGILFALNPETLEIVKSKEIYETNWNLGHYWRPVHLRWGKDGLLYTTLGEKLTVVNPETLEYRTLANTSLMTLGDTGDIYYTTGSRLNKISVSYPLSEVTISVGNTILEKGRSSNLNISGKLGNGGIADLKGAVIEYVSSNPEIVSVANGIITANSEGSSEISAKITLNGVTAESNKIIVKVIYKPVSVSIITNMDKLQANQNFKADVSLTNNEATKGYVIAIAALYDQDNKLLNINYTSAELNSGDTIILNPGFKLPENTVGCKVKILVWDGSDLKTTRMMPLADVITIQ